MFWVFKYLGNLWYSDRPVTIHSFWFWGYFLNTIVSICFPGLLCFNKCEDEMQTWSLTNFMSEVSIIWNPSSEFVSSSIPSWQILTAHAQPFRGVRDLAFCLKVPLDSLLVWASSEGSGETVRMRRLAWTFAARIGDKYQIRLSRSIWSVWNLWAESNKINMHNLLEICNKVESDIVSKYFNAIPTSHVYVSLGKANRELKTSFINRVISSNLLMSVLLHVLRKMLNANLASDAYRPVL